MNRRKALQITGALAFSGVLAYSGYEYCVLNEKVRSNYFANNIVLLAELVESIIPETDTPGAKESLVHHFIVKMLDKCATDREKNTFFRGLEKIKHMSKTRFNKDFLDCNAKDRYEILDHIEKSDRVIHGFFGKVQKKLLGEPFFVILKRYTINGYCTSFLGATKNFRYDYIPVKFEACIDYKSGTPSWATK